MKALTLRQLRYVAALARHGHFGRAADACAVSQPALSMQIKALEADVGAPLFERGPRDVRPTALGEAFAARAADVLRGVAELEALAAAAADGRGRLRLGVIPTVAPYLLPRLLPALAARHPGLEPRIRETLTDRLLAELADGRLDGAILALPLEDPALQAEPLLTEPLVLARPAAQAAEPLPDLAEAPLLLLEEGHCFRDQALAWCGARAAGGRLDGASLATLTQMVAAGAGVTLLPAMAVAVETRAAAVAVAPLPAPAPTRTLALAWRRSSPLGATLRAVAETARQAAA